LTAKQLLEILHGIFGKAPVIAKDRLAHSSWDCKYHVVIVPKRRSKVLFGQARRKLGKVLHAVAPQKECQIIEGHLLPDHVHMCIAIPVHRQNFVHLQNE
jgi:REP element-mobilizing transposase RayT